MILDDADAALDEEGRRRVLSIFADELAGDGGDRLPLQARTGPGSTPACCAWSGCPATPGWGSAPAGGRPGARR